MSESHLGKPKRVETEITTEEKVAFRELLNSLILAGSDTNLELKQENTKEISRLIQDNFLKVFCTVDGDGNYIYPQSGFNLENYENWSFTPRLALERKREYVGEEKNQKLGINCLAKAILTGAYLKFLKKDIQMGIASDHPEVLAKDDRGWSFLNLDHEGPLKEEFPCEEEEKKGYKILRIKKGYGYEEIFVQTLFFVVDFDDAVLFELLENIEILRRMSLGIEVESLPGTYNAGMEIARKYAEVLQATDWGKLQTKLFPEIINIFAENEEEFANERREVLANRVIALADQTFREALVLSQEKTELAGKDFKEAQGIILEKSKLNRKEIFMFLYWDRDFPIDTDRDVVIFYKEFKSYLLEQKFEEDNTRKVIAYLFMKVIKNLYTEEELSGLFAKL